MNPKYPVYIISKGRWESRQTSKSLEAMEVPYKIVIEPQEYDDYSSVIDPSKIITLPFSNLQQASIPARNWVWEDALSKGWDRYWLLDDNINGFMRLNKNYRGKVNSGTIFRCAEDFVDRYENVALAGFEYRHFSGGARRKKPAYRLNSRIYSCTLIKTDLPYRWRGLYNEDTDLCLRILKEGWCTVMFNCFLQNKAGTMIMKGGNTDEIYLKTDNRREFAESLKEQHPDVADIVWRYGRWHHQVDYSSFRGNKLIKKEGLVIPEGVNNYGMKLIEVDK